MAASAEEAKRAVKKCYPTLLELLPIGGLVNRFISHELLSLDRKSKLDSLTSREKIRYFLDEMLIPGLSIGYTGHFDEMVTMMKESDDILVRSLVKKLMPDVSKDVSVITSTADYNEDHDVSLTSTGIE